MHGIHDNMLEVIKGNQGIQLELWQKMIPFEWCKILKGNFSYISSNIRDIKSQNIVSGVTEWLTSKFVR